MGLKLMGMEWDGDIFVGIGLMPTTVSLFRPDPRVYP